MSYWSKRCWSAIFFDELEEYWDAIAELDALLAQSPDDYVSLNNRGLMHWEIGRLAEAERDLKSACRLAAADPLPHENLGRFLEERGERELAIESYQRAVDISPDSTSARANLDGIRSGTSQSESS